MANNNVINTIGGGSITIDSTPTAGSTNAVSSGGVKTYVDGHYVTAGQKFGTTLGTKATAEGEDATASGYSAHAEGNNTTASGYSAHAEGVDSTASRDASHAEGWNTTASGDYSHSEGNNTTAQRKSQHVFGEYNILDTTGANGTVRGSYVEIVGNGIENARSNARTLDWSGNEVLAGKLTVGVAPTANMDVATKQYVDNAIGNAIAASY